VIEHEKDISAEQALQGKKARFPCKDVFEERKKNTQCQKEKGKKEAHSLTEHEENPE